MTQQVVATPSLSTLRAPRALDAVTRVGVVVPARDEEERIAACLDAIAGKAQDTGNSHGSRPQYITLDRDAVTIAAGYLHHSRVTLASQQSTDSDTGHVAVGTRTVGRVDGIYPAIENTGPAINFPRIRCIGRRHLRGYRKASGPQHLLKTPR